MIKIVHIPVVWTMNREAAFLAQSRGELEGIKAEREKEQTAMESELDNALNEGYRVIASHTVEGSQRVIVCFVLHKSPESKSDPR